MLTATQHSECDYMNPANPAQNAEYAPSCDAVTMAAPDSRRPGIEAATNIRGSNQLTPVEVADEVIDFALRLRAKCEASPYLQFQTFHF
jgi:hypothetical protein